MKNPKLANRYAKALFDFAKEKEQLETVQNDLLAIRSALKENTELQIILNSPIVPPTKKHTIFTNVFQNLIGETTFIFLDVIIKKKREPALDSICEEFIKLYNDFHHIKTVTLTTAQEMSEPLIEEIRKMLAEQTRHEIVIKQIIKPEIIGGILVKMDDFYFDASVISKINKLRQAFAHNIYQVNF